MQIAGAHLTSCTNIHPGESWEQVFENIRTHVLAVKARVAPEQAFGVGLRLSAQAARRLREPEQLAEFRRFLDRLGYDYIDESNNPAYRMFLGR